MRKQHNLFTFLTIILFFTFILWYYVNELKVLYVSEKKQEVTQVDFVTSCFYYALFYCYTRVKRY